MSTRGETSKGKEPQTIASESNEPQTRPELNEFAKAADYHEFLTYCQAKAQEANPESAPYIHKSILSFKNSADKANWLDFFEDAKERSLFSEFWKAKKTDDAVDPDSTGNTKETPGVWLALCSTAASNWVGKGAYDADKEVWHVWAVVVVKRKDGKGKHILVFDADKKEPLVNTRLRSALLGHQLGFIEQAKWAVEPRKGLPANGLNGPALKVWLGGGVLDGEVTRGKDKCVEYGARWLEKMAMLPAEGVDGDDVTADTRFGAFGFVQLRS